MSDAATLQEEDGLAGHAWVRTLTAAWFAQFASIAGFAFAMPFLPFYLAQLGVHGAVAQRYWSGLIGSAPAVTMMLVAPFWGIAADRYGRKLMVMRAMFSGAVVVALMGAVGSPVTLLVLRFMQGALTGTISATNAMVSGVSPRKRAGFSLGLMQSAVFLGNCVGPLLGGMFADAYGYSATFYMAGAFLLLGGIVIAALAQDSPLPPREPDGRNGKSEVGILSVLATPGFVIIIGVVFLLQFAGTVLSPVFPLFVESLVHDSSAVNTHTGRLIAVTAISAALVAVPIGWLSDRIGPRNVLAAGTLLSGCLMLPQAFVTQLTTLYEIRIALGLAAGAIGPAMGGFVNRAVPRSSQGKAFGIVQSASSFGFALGPFTGGALGAEFGLRAPFVVVGTLQIVFGIGAWIALGRLSAAGRVKADQTAETKDISPSDGEE
ncbi:MAG TPA: MFS transporter [Candidatus Brocadiia bacterium]|nr:MFS transporter [Candidatus Brocadiia bacterium]